MKVFPVAVAAGLLLSLLTPAGAVEPTAGSRTFLILPFDDSAPDPDRDWLREAMVFSLGDFFAAAGQNVVDREERLLALDEIGVPAGAPLTLATSIRVGRYLRSREDVEKPDRLVVGRLSLDRGQISISARVLRLESDQAGPWKQASGSLQDLLRLQRTLAHEILRGEGVSSGNLAGAADNAAAGGDFPLIAYENYVRALLDPDPDRQQTLLRKAVQQSPGYPKATYQLAARLARAGRNAEAETVLGRIAAEPVPFTAPYHLLLGEIAFRADRLTPAEEEIRRSVSIRESAEAHILLARLQHARGNLEAARQELARAAAMDPENSDLDALRKLLSAGPAPPG